MAIELTAPKNYSEMNDKQLRYVAALMLAGQTEDQIMTKCFIKFTKIKPITCIGDDYYFVCKNIKGFFSLKTTQVAEFSKKFSFLTSNFKGISPVHKIGSYKAVDRLLRNTQFIQYLDIENNYQAYIYTKDEKYLTKLLACLYIKKSYDKTDTISAEKYLLKKTSKVERLIVTMWMVGMKQELALKFKHLFPQKKNDTDDDSMPPNMLEIITNQVRLLTDGDITKNKQILAANTWDALTELDNKCREYNKLKN